MAKQVRSLRYHGKAGAEPSKAAAEGFKLLGLLKGAQNVPRSSFEAQ